MKIDPVASMELLRANGDGFELPLSHLGMRHSFNIPLSQSVAAEIVSSVGDGEEHVRHFRVAVTKGYSRISHIKVIVHFPLLLFSYHSSLRNND